jgi:mono/diheme cytochrome c family protein
MRRGVDRGGRHLYPVFPYDHFARMTDEDIGAVYAYVMTREPVRAERTANELPFPLDIRMSIAAWKLLFLHEQRHRDVPEASAQWNRGAYLVQGAAHCGACHTPRNLLGAEKKKQAFAGGESGPWHAPALNKDSPAPVPWTAESLYAYLRRGLDELHDVPAGPMQPVVQNLAAVPEDDVRAIAAYVASLHGRAEAEVRKMTEEALARARKQSEAAEAAVVAPAAAKKAGESGAAIYSAACGSCHNLGRVVSGGALPLTLSSAVRLPTPRNLMHIVRGGIVPPEGERGPWMPDFAGALNDAQLVSLLEYLRAYYGEKPAWRDLADDVKETAQ